MRVLGFDVETSGLDPAVHRVTEYGWALWDTDRGAPVLLGGGLTIPNPDEPDELTPDIIELTHITNELRRTFGRWGADLLSEMATAIARFGVERIAAHNAPFDRSFLLAELDRLVGFDRGWLEGVKWIDTRRDLPFQCGSAKLNHLAADRGILNPFKHRSVFDALTACMVLQTCPLDDVIARADSPFVVLQSVHAFADNDLAKKLKFGFKAEFGKRWLKVEKEMDVPVLLEKAAAIPQLRVRRINDVTPEQVMA